MITMKTTPYATEATPLFNAGTGGHPHANSKILFSQIPNFSFAIINHQ